MTIDRYYDPPAAAPALINPTTDSWTAVLGQVVELAGNIANTDFVPKDMRGSTPKVVAAILHSRELGLPPMTGLAGSHVINGRPGISAELMRSLIEQAGHELRITEMTSDRCVMKGRRSTWESGDWATVAYSMQDAIRAGDAKKNANYQSRPAEMLLARCTTRIARMVFADVIHGMRSVEELIDMGGDYSDAAQPPIQQTTAQVSRQVAAPAAPPVEEGPAPSLGAPGEAPRAGVAPSEQRPATPATEPARKRPPLKPRGMAVAPEAEPEPPADDEPVEAEVVEIVEAPPAKSPAATVEDEWRRKTMIACQMHWERLLGSPVARDERIWWAGILAGRPVESTNELTDEELEKLCKLLGRLRNRTQLEATVDSTTPGEAGPDA